MSGILFAAAVVGFVGVGGWLTHIDIRDHRLPNRILLPATLALVALCAGGAVADGSALPFGRGLAGGLILGAAYLLLRAASRGALGGGDVKLAVPIGLLLAWDGWIALAAGGILAFVVGGVWAVWLIASRRGSRSTHIPFGPCMILGAVLGLAVT